MNNDNSVEKITLTYSDGTTKDIDKGLVFRIKENPEKDTAEITADMVGMSGKDLFTVVQAAVELGIRLGMFNGVQRIGGRKR